MGGDLDFGFEPSGFTGGYAPTDPGVWGSAATAGPSGDLGIPDVPGLTGGGGGWTTADLSTQIFGQPGGGGGWQNFLAGIFGGGGGDQGSGLGGLAKNVLGLGQLGLAGYQAAQGVKAGQQLAGQTKLAQQSGQMQMDIAQKAVGAAQPLTQFSQQELADAQAGKLPAAMQANIDLWARAAKARVQDYAARSGMGDSSTLATWLAWIDQQAEGMKSEALQNMMGLGITAGAQGGNILAQAAGAAGGAGRTAAGQQQSLETLIQQANQALARIGAGAG